jgi:hypothetical protein
LEFFDDVCVCVNNLSFVSLFNQLANAHNFIVNDLQGGYQCFVGEKGTQLRYIVFSSTERSFFILPLITTFYPCLFVCLFVCF